MQQARYIAYAAVCTIIMLIATSFFAMYLLNEPLAFSKESVVIEIKKKQSLASVVNELKSQKLVSYPSLLFWYIRLKGQSTHIKAGEYKILATSSTIDLINQLTQGKIYYRSITLIEGWSIQQVREALNQNPYIRHDTKNLSNDSLRQWFNKRYNDSYTSLEGLFYPDTYWFARETSDRYILRQAREAMKKIMRSEWKRRQNKLPYRSAYQSLIAASLIEKETAHHEEKKLIAGVIVARLKRGMKLQIDPTVIYALGSKFDGQLNHSELRTPSRHNTYMHRGLPPTPIALPGRRSIVAALHPKRTKHLYYRSKGDGSHTFSRTFKQHKNANPSKNTGKKSDTGQ